MAEPSPAMRTLAYNMRTMKKTRTKSGLTYSASFEEQQMLCGAISSHKLILRKASKEAMSRRGMDPIDARMWQMMASACDKEEERFSKLFAQL